MMIVVVYKITRVDDLEYIGTTVNLKKRIAEHLKTDRFANGIKSVVILEECSTYELAEATEEKFIHQYDTYRHGLNMTPTGHGKNENCKFNTFGLTHSKKTREKMSDNHWSKKGIKSWHAGRSDVYSEKTRTRWSTVRSNKVYGRRVIEPYLGKLMIAEFENDKLHFEPAFIQKFVKKTQHEMIETLDFSQLVSPNGTPLSKMTLYCQYYAELYSVTPSAIRRILSGKIKFSGAWNQ